MVFRLYDAFGFVVYSVAFSNDQGAGHKIELEAASVAEHNTVKTSIMRQQGPGIKIPIPEIFAI